jgi:hypothetical protein
MGLWMKMSLAQMEYQLDLPRHHGMSSFFGGGTIEVEMNKFSVDELRATVGMRCVFQVKPRANLRLGLVFGGGESVFLFNVNEHF